MAYTTKTYHAKTYPWTSIMASPYSCDPTGVTDCAAALESLKTNQANVGTIHIPKGTFRIATDLTIPVGMTLTMEAGAVISIEKNGAIATDVIVLGIVDCTRGGSFVVAADCTLTISGTFNGSTAIFSGAGTVTVEAPFRISNYASLPDAITAIGATRLTLIIDTATSVAADATIPKTLTLQVAPPGIFNIATTKTLTINGPVDAGLYQIFACAGTGVVDFTGSSQIEKVPVQWFGATGDGTTDDTLTVAKAGVSVEGSDIPLFFPKGNYVLTRQSYFTETVWAATDVYYAVKFTDKIIIRGDRATITVSATDAAHTTAFAVVGTSGAIIGGVSISGLHFIGTGSPSSEILNVGSPIELVYCKDATIRDITMDSTRSGLKFIACSNCVIERYERWIPSDANHYRTTHMGIHHSTEIVLRDSSFWGAAGDADVLIMGTGTARCLIAGVNIYAYAKGDATKTVNYIYGEGIDCDSGSEDIKITGCYIYGYYYGISSKSNSYNIIITGNTVEKCKVGIVSWYGTAPAGEQENTVIANNVIIPDGYPTSDAYMGLFQQVGVAVLESFGALVQGNTICNTLGTSADFTGIVCSFDNDSYSEWHQNGYNIIGNRIVMLNGHAGQNSISTIWAMYFLGSSTAVTNYQHGLNVQGNQIKVNMHTNSSTPVVYGRYLSNFSFVNNVFINKFDSDFPIMDIRDSKMVDISGNHFPSITKGHCIYFDTVSGAKVNNNHLGTYGYGGAAARNFIAGATVKDLQVNNNNKYYAQVSNELDFVSVTLLDNFTAIGNHVKLGASDRSNWLNLTGMPIEGMTRAAACVVTWTGHGKATGDKIQFAAITQTSWTALNGNEYAITYIGADTFSIAVNTSGYAADYVPATDDGTYWFQEVGYNQVTKGVM